MAFVFAVRSVAVLAMILDIPNRRVFFELSTSPMPPTLGRPVALFQRGSLVIVYGVAESFTMQNDDDTLIVRFREMRAARATPEDFEYITSLDPEEAIQVAKDYT